MSDNKIIKCLEVNPSTPQPEGWGLLRVDPERRISTPPSKTELGAVERVKCKSGELIQRILSEQFLMVTPPTKGENQTTSKVDHFR